MTIGGAFTGSSLTLGAWLTPGDVTFDLAQDVTLNAAENRFGFSSATKSLVKRGAGMLRLKPMWNYNVCDWHVYAGTLTTSDEWVGDNNTFGDTTKDVTIHVHDGATLEEPSNRTLGYHEDTAEAEDHAVNVTVHAGGMFRPGKTGTHAYPFATVKDLVFDGGAFDFTKRGYWGRGLLKVTRTLAFGGASPYVLNRPNGNSGKIAFASSRQTEIRVADITDDDAADLTVETENIGRVNEAAVVGLTKAGAGTLRWNAKIHNSYNREGWAGWLGLNGPITVKEGKLVLANAANAMEGTLEVSGGELWLGAERGKYVPTDTRATYAGNLQVEGREIVASRGRRLPRGRRRQGVHPRHGHAQASGEGRLRHLRSGRRVRRGSECDVPVRRGRRVRRGAGGLRRLDIHGQRAAVAGRRRVEALAARQPVRRPPGARPLRHDSIGEGAT